MGKFSYMATVVAVLVASCIVFAAVEQPIIEQPVGIGLIDSFQADFTLTVKNGGNLGYNYTRQDDSSIFCLGSGFAPFKGKEDWQTLTKAVTADGLPVKIGFEEVEKIVYDNMRIAEVPDRNWEDALENIDPEELQVMQKMQQHREEMQQKREAMQQLRENIDPEKLKMLQEEQKKAMQQLNKAMQQLDKTLFRENINLEEFNINPEEFNIDPKEFNIDPEEFNINPEELRIMREEYEKAIQEYIKTIKEDEYGLSQEKRKEMLRELGVLSQKWDDASLADWELLQKKNILPMENILPTTVWKYSGVVTPSYYYAPTKEFVVKVIKWQAITLKDYKWELRVIVIPEKEYRDDPSSAIKKYLSKKK